MLQCFAINLARDVHRLQNVLQQFQGHENAVKLNIVEAIDARTSPQVTDIHANYKEQIIKGSIYMMSLGEIACFLSHQKALLEFLQTDQKYALIVEDDIVLTDDFWKNIEAIIGYYKNFDDILLNLLPTGNRFVTHNISTPYYKIDALDGIDIVAPFFSATGAVCYLISRKIAIHILKQEPTTPYDLVFHSLHKHNINYYTLSQKITQLMDIESSVDSTHIAGRTSARSRTIQNYGWCAYKINRIKVQFKYKTSLALYNIKKFGLLRTIKVKLKIIN